jgi:hypothetical protein
VIVRTLQTLVDIAGQTTQAPSISPGPDGSLQLAWYVREFDLEIDIPVSGDPTGAFYEHASGKEVDLAIPSSKLREVIEQLASG